MTEEGQMLECLTLALLPVASEPLAMAELYRNVREFCHVVRNRLNCMKISLYLASLDAEPEESRDLADLDRIYNGIERFMDEIQSLCRPMEIDPMPLGLGVVLDDRRAAWEHWFRERRLHLDWLRPSIDPVGRFDPVRLTSALDAFAAWRASCAPIDSHIRVAWGVEGDQILMTWEEPMANLEADLAPVEDRPAPLALALLARVAAVHQGRLDLASQPRGLRLRLRWPLDDRRESSDGS